jgi:hypothetical protein
MTHDVLDRKLNSQILAAGVLIAGVLLAVQVTVVVA